MSSGIQTGTILGLDSGPVLYSSIITPPLKQYLDPCAGPACVPPAGPTADRRRSEKLRYCTLSTLASLDRLRNTVIVNRIAAYNNTDNPRLRLTAVGSTVEYEVRCRSKHRIALALYIFHAFT